MRPAVTFITRFMKIRLLTALSLLSAVPGLAQPTVSHSCAEGKRAHFRNFSKAAIASPAEEDYDVKYVKLDIALNNTNIAVAGSVQTNAVARVTMNQYVFELNNSLTIDSVKVNGQARTVATSGIVRTVSLPNSIAAGAAFTTQIWYRGTPTRPNPNASIGIYNQTSPSWGNRVTYTLSEPYGAKDWWPCKQSLQDKIDSADIWITVPDSLKAGSNGVLQAVTPLSGSRARYEWKSRYPIDHYLISASVAKYVDYSFHTHFPGTGDSVLMQNYVYDNPQTLPFFKSMIDSMGAEMIHFSDIFGRYPFWQEKYGHCMAPLGGGMEHQTMTTIGYFSGTVRHHELAHQWWGDYVTCATWKDIWVNEGFASYSEDLFLEHFYGKAAARAHMSDKHYNSIDGVTSAPDGSVYVDDTTDDGRIFDNRLTYNKGASVVHMLRYLAPSDSVFFLSLRTYLQRFAFGTATIDSFKTTVQPFFTRNLDTFFNEWIYGEGYPIYNARWNAVNGKVYVNLAQQGSAPQSVPVFHYPVEVKISGAQGDTTVVIEMTGASETIAFNWTKPVASVQVDADDRIPHKTTGVVRDATLEVTDVAQQNPFTIAPNPTQTAWVISGNMAGSWSLFNLTGKRLLQGTVLNKVEIPARNLPSGIYQFQIQSKDGSVYTERLLRD